MYRHQVVAVTNIVSGVTVTNKSVGGAWVVWTVIAAVVLLVPLLTLQPSARYCQRDIVQMAHSSKGVSSTPKWLLQSS